jgi:hypothetical protein
MDHLRNLIYNNMFLDFQWCNSQHYCHMAQAHTETSQVLQHYVAQSDVCTCWSTMLLQIKSREQYDCSRKFCFFTVIHRLTILIAVFLCSPQFLQANAGKYITQTMTASFYILCNPVFPNPSLTIKYNPSYPQHCLMDHKVIRNFFANQVTLTIHWIILIWDGTGFLLNITESY